MAFDWKEFLRPSWKKTAIFIVAYLLFAPLFVCLFSYEICGLSGGSMRAGCPRQQCNIIDFLHSMTQFSNIAFVYFFEPLLSMVIAIGTLNPFLVVFFWLPIELAYLVACLLVHFFQKKAPSRAKKKK